MHPLPPRHARFLAALAAALAFAVVAAESARVAGIIDGDSVRLADGRELRLLGINTPEFGRDGTPAQPLARAAEARVRALALERRVRLGFGPEREDHYGRLLAYVTLPDGRVLQEILLEEGLAWFVAIAPNVAHVEAYRAAEARARERRRGVWGLAAYAPVPAEDLGVRETGFRRISGTIRSVRLRRDRAELRLAPRLTVVMPRTLAAALGPAPVGKRIVARGWVSAHKRRLRLRITHAAMVESVS